MPKLRITAEKRPVGAPRSQERTQATAIITELFATRNHIPFNTVVQALADNGLHLSQLMLRNIRRELSLGTRPIRQKNNAEIAEWEWYKTTQDDATRSRTTAAPPTKGARHQASLDAQRRLGYSAHRRASTRAAYLRKLALRKYGTDPFDQDASAPPSCEGCPTNPETRPSYLRFVASDGLPPHLKTPHPGTNVGWGPVLTELKNQGWPKGALRVLCMPCIRKMQA